MRDDDHRAGRGDSSECRSRSFATLWDRRQQGEAGRDEMEQVAANEDSAGDSALLEGAVRCAAASDLLSFRNLQTNKKGDREENSLTVRAGHASYIRQRHGTRYRGLRRS